MGCLFSAHALPRCKTASQGEQDQQKTSFGSPFTSSVADLEKGMSLVNIIVHLMLTLNIFKED